MCLVTAVSPHSRARLFTVTDAAPALVPRARFVNVGDADYPLWTVHIADLPTGHGSQSCARCGEAIADEGLSWPRGHMVAIRQLKSRQEIRLIDSRDDLLADERACGREQ